MQETPSLPPRYRTIQQCYQAIKKLDNDTAITEWFIRQLCNSGKIKYYKNGNKSLVNLDNLLGFLNCGLEDTINDNSEDKDNEQR